MSAFIERAEALTREAGEKREEAAKLAAQDQMSQDEAARFDLLVSQADDLDAEVSDLRARDERAKANAKAAAAYTETANRRTTNVVADLGGPVLDGPAREAIKDDPKHGFSGLGEFAASVYASGIPGGSFDNRLHIGAAATGLNQNSGADGGFLVPPAFGTMIWDGMNADPLSLVERCDTYTVEGESLTMPANAETSRATGSRYGGVRGYWINEAAQITSSKPTFRQLKLEPQELAVLCYATDKLLRNSPVALEQYLTRAATDEITFLSNDAIVNGDGVGKPLGILNGGSTVSVAKESGQSAATLVKANIDKMWARLHSRSRATAVWLINQDVHPQLQALGDTGNNAVYLPAGGMSAAQFGTLKGRPVIECESCATLGTVGDILLVDLSAYALGVQGGVNAAASIHLRFDYMETAFRFSYAIDGQPWLASAITPFKGSNTVSPFISLATRA